MKFLNDNLSAVFVVMLTLFSGSIQPMSVLKGTYDCLQEKYGYISPYSGAVFFEAPIIKNIYHYGLQAQVDISEDKKEYVDITVGLVKTLFHENEGQFIASKKIQWLAPELVGLIIGHMINGDFADDEKSKEATQVIIEKCKKGLENIKLTKEKNDLVSKDIERVVPLIIDCYQECNGKNKDDYIPHITESILISFLYAKFQTEETLQNQGKSYFVKYLKGVEGVSNVLAKSKDNENELLIDTKDFLSQKFASDDYIKFEDEIKNLKDSTAQTQINYMEDNFERALNAIVIRRFYASVVPKEVLQSTSGFSFDGQKDKRPDCVETALLDFLVNLILFNPTTKAYDLGLVEGLSVNQELVSMIKNGVSIKNPITQQEETIFLTPQTLNDPSLRQIWFDLVSGNKEFKYNRGGTGNVFKIKKHQLTKFNRRYELLSTLSNTLKLANFLYGTKATTLDELAKALSNKKQAITFDFEDQSQYKTDKNDSDRCIITMELIKMESGPKIKAELHITPSHATLEVPLRNVSTVLETYYAKGIDQQLIKDGLSKPESIMLFALFANKNLLNDGVTQWPLSTLYLLYYSLAMTDPNIRCDVVCDMITQIKYHKKLLPYLKETIQRLPTDDHFKKTIAAALLNEHLKNEDVIILNDWIEYIKILTKNPTEGLVDVCNLTKDYPMAVKYLVDNGADINTKGYHGDTALMMASDRGHLGVVKYLVDNKVDINIKDEYGNTALMMASKAGRLEVVKYLVDNGADINAKDRYGETALMMASERGYLGVVKCLVDNKADINTKDKYDRTALMMASLCGHLEVVKCLVDNKADINTKDDNGETALMRASYHGHLEIVKYLVDNKADINAKDVYGESVLMMASKAGRLEVVKYLVDNKADINAKDNYGKTALMRASYRGQLEVVKYLVDNKADINTKDDNGNTALKEASESGHLEVVTYLKGKSESSFFQRLYYIMNYMSE